MVRKLPDGTPDLPPVGILIALSLMFPGAGQLANDEKEKGIVFGALAIITMVAFFYQLGAMGIPVYKAMAAGNVPDFQTTFYADLSRLGWIFGVGVIISVVATVDAVRVGRRNLSNF